MTALKVTLTLPEEMLTVIDRYVASTPGATRSGVCSEALKRWLQDQQDAEIAHYYQTLSDEEHAEDTAWALIASHSAEQSWQ
jgi:metal-responsive CopG/Arc/MetJ family transcriptional regulator